MTGLEVVATLKRRNYPEEAIGKILGGNLLRVLRQFCQYNLLSPTIESNAFD
jgi:microsomal dipeptidase-like Zn-dependent dipeptidase